MKETTKYTCSHCGQVHDDWPALAFDSPAAYHELSQEMKQEIGELTTDFCIIRHPEQTDRFVRGTLDMKVVDGCEELKYGVWVSLSEKSFEDYSSNFNNPHHEAGYFGWLSSHIPEYDNAVSIPTNVFTRQGGLRPEIVPHEGFDHQLVRDYYHGITKAEAEKRIQRMLTSIRKTERESLPAKPWWKFW